MKTSTLSLIVVSALTLIAMGAAHADDTIHLNIVGTGSGDIKLAAVKAAAPAPVSDQTTCKSMFDNGTCKVATDVRIFGLTTQVKTTTTDTKMVKGRKYGFFIETVDTETTGPGNKATGTDFQQARSGSGTVGVVFTF